MLRLQGVYKEASGCGEGTEGVAGGWRVGGSRNHTLALYGVRVQRADLYGISTNATPEL